MACGGESVCLGEPKVDLLTSTQGFFNNEAANATSGSEYQDAHRV